MAPDAPGSATVATRNRRRRYLRLLVGTVAAVAFAVVLYKIVRSDAVAHTLSSIIRSALNVI